MATQTISCYLKEECHLDEILHELPNRVAKPVPSVKGNNLSFSKFLHQISDSLKDLHLVYTCLDVSSLNIALGTNVGNAFIYQRNQRKVIKISSETKYVPTTCIKLANCGIVAFGHESGTFSVGFVDPPVHRSFDSLTAQDIHTKSITCLEWSDDGLILYAGDSEGNVSMSVVKISEAILQTAMVFQEAGGITQLSYITSALLVSTTKRTLLWPFQTEEKIQVGEKERKTAGSFGAVFTPGVGGESMEMLYAARPGQRIWKADLAGKVLSTSVFKSLLEKKPQTILTMDGDDSKVKSGGQFGTLLNFYRKFVVTWNNTHLWVLDLENGVVVGCHSNLGKIHDVSVSGHELFVLLNQQERFLQRFTLINEDIGPMSLDAVVATPDQTWNNPMLVSQGNTEEKSENENVRPLPDVMQPSQPQSVQDTVVTANNDVDLFQRINTSCCDNGEIVFTAAKKKKKKKKPKQDADPKKMSEIEPRGLDVIEGVRNEHTISPAEYQVDNQSPISIQSNDTSSPGDTEKHGSNELLYPLKDTVAPEIESSHVGEGSKSLENPEIFVESKNTSTSHEVLLTTVVAATADEMTDPCSSIECDGTSPSLLKEGTKEDRDLSMDEENCEREDTLQSENVHDQGKALITVPSVEAPDLSSEIPVEFESDQCQPDIMTSSLLGNFDQQQPEATEKKSVEEIVVETNNILKVSNTLDSIAISGEDKDVLSSGEEQGLFSPTGQDPLDFNAKIQLLEETSTYLREDSYTPTLSASFTQETEEGSHDRTQIKDYQAPMFADTWSKCDLPTTQVISSLAISDNHVFCVDARDRVFHTEPSSVTGEAWEQVDWKAKEVYVDSLCHLVAFRGKGKKAYIRGHVNKVPPVGDASYLIAEEVALMTSCAKCSWVFTLNNVLKKADTSVLLELKGDLKNSRIWHQEDSLEKLCQIVCYHGVLWGRTTDNLLQVYAASHCGKKSSWLTVKEKRSKWISMSNDGTLWVITPTDEIWFKPGISSENADGEAWYQVTLGQYIIDDASMVDSAFNFFYSVGSAYKNSRTTEYLRNAAKGLLQSTKDMACSLFRDGGNPKQICCNTKSGVWLLDTKNALHACRGQVTGSYWELVCPSGTAKSATWHQVTTGIGNFVWALQPNGELTCFDPNGPAYNVTSPSSNLGIDFITSSPHGVWCFSSLHPTRLYIRDGISHSYPYGFEWVALNLSQHEITGVKHISIGRITVWALDQQGHVWIRIGQVSGDGASVLTQAWVPIDPPENITLEKIEVNSDDSMVWAVDSKGSVYARDSVSQSFLIGEGWRQVDGTTLKSLCLSSNMVYGLCLTGEIVCRFGVSPTNCGGDYWKKIPGNFSQISINDTGKLWAISSEELLFMRNTKCLLGGRTPVKELEDKVVEPDVLVSNDGDESTEEDCDWEML